MDLSSECPGRRALTPRLATSGDDRPVPLLERETEQGALDRALRRAVDGSGSLVIVEGPAGIGKTRLIAEAGERGRREEFLVRLARGGEMERDMAFGVARQLFEPLIQRASQEEREAWLSGSASLAMAALGAFDSDRSQSTTDPFAAINGLYWLVANLSLSQRLLLIVDDAQWSDKASLRFAAFLARRLEDLPVVMILGVRTGEPGTPSELQALRLEADSLDLQPLTLGSVHELIEIRTGEEPSVAFSETCARVSAGNPFLVIEILRELGSDAQTLDDDAATSIAQLVPDNVARTVLFRLGRFGEEGIALARAIAVLGRAPQLRHAAQLAGVEEQRAQELSDDLRAAEILASGMPIEFVHPLVRQAIYLELPEGERYAAHRRTAEILAATGAPPDEVGSHLLACAPNGDPWVVARLEDAAREAMGEGASDTAVIYLERALEEPPEDDPPLLYLLGKALVETEMAFRAPQILTDVAARAADHELRIDALRRLVAAQIAIGDLTAAARTCDEAIEAVGDSDREVSLDLEAQRCFMIYGSGGFDPETSTRIESVAGSLRGTTTGERVARQALAWDRFMMCAPVDEALQRVLPFPELPWKIRDLESAITIAAPKLLAYSGRWDDARTEWGGWIELSHRQGRLLMVSIGNSFLAEVDRLSGRLHESEAQARTAWEIAQLPGGLSPFRWSALMNLAATLLARGDIEGFTELTHGFDLSAGPTEIPLNPWPLELRACFHRDQGDIEAAVDDFLRLGDALERIGWLNPSVPPSWRQEATEALAALGRTSEAEELISVAGERALSFGAPHTIAGVLRARSMIEPRARAVETLRASVTMFEASGPPHELARSLIALGSALRRGGDRTESRKALSRALELAHRCGAGGLEGAARDELARAGSRPRRAVQTGVGALTASEAKTARLAADGLTNKEIAERLFVTLRTVETHLTHVYEKLAIIGRRELTRALAENAG